MINLKEQIINFREFKRKQITQNYLYVMMLTINDCFKDFEYINSYEINNVVNNYLDNLECKQTTKDLKRKYLFYFLEYVSSTTAYKLSKTAFNKIKYANAVQHKSINKDILKKFDIVASTPKLLKDKEKMLYWIYRTNGIRLDEWNLIDWEDVKYQINSSDKSKAIIYSFYPEKNSNPRLLRIKPEYFNLVLQFAKTMHKHTLMDIFKRISLKASTYFNTNLKIESHNLRHAFVTTLYEKGLRAEEIQKYTGHKNLNVLVNTYIAYNPELVKEGFASAQDLLLED